MQEKVLTEEEIGRFHERGVLTFDFGFDQDHLDEIVRTVDGLYDESYRENPHAAIRIQDAWKKNENVRKLAISQCVLSALEQLIDRKPLPFQTLNFPVGTSQAPHSDTIHFSTVPQGYMAGVWVALEDIDQHNGPLVYYPGSHNLPCFSMQDLGLYPGYQNYSAYERRIGNLIVEHNLQPEYGVIKKGEAIIWHANLLHGGAPRKDLNRTRHSQVTHYYFEGCDYYTPMESVPGGHFYRQPTWIPQTAEFDSSQLKRPSIAHRLASRWYLWRRNF